MLSTLLEIGKIFRESNDGLKHHRYVKRGPQHDSNPKNAKAIGNSTRFFRVPVSADGNFDFAQREEFNDEHLIEKLFYLNYKTSDAESTKKYIFGDILRVVDAKTGKESGNFLRGKEAGKDKDKNSFIRGREIAATIENEIITHFRDSFEKQLDEIVSHLELHPNCYLHFAFNGLHWHQTHDVLKAINLSFLEHFTVQVTDSNGDLRGRVLRKALYKTLASTIEGPSGRIVNFTTEHEYKNRVFESDEEVLDLIHAINTSQKPAIYKTDVKIIVLPRGNDLSAEQIERFFTRQPLESNQPEAKAQRIRDDVAAAEEENEDEETSEELFAAALDGATDNMAQFDFIFSKASSSPSSPDVDLIEVPGLERGLLEYLSKRVVTIRRKIEKKRFTSDKAPPLSIALSFLNILGDTTKAKKKYQSHLFKVLPQIYTGTYYRDDVLLPALIEKTEFNVRNDEKLGFNILKFDFEFLTRILNCKENRMKEIKQSPSYKVGFFLGQMAKPFGHDKTPIKSFKKQYVGLLSRRITTVGDVMRLGAEIREKLEMHEVEIIRDQHYFPRRAIDDFFETASDFPMGINYNRHECAFGFFHSYSSLPPKKETATNDGGEDAVDDNAE